MTTPSQAVREAPWLFVQMTDDGEALLTWCADEAEISRAVAQWVYCEPDDLDGAETEQVKGITESLIEDGFFDFEGDPGLKLFRVSAHGFDLASAPPASEEGAQGEPECIGTQIAKAEFAKRWDEAAIRRDMVDEAVTPEFLTWLQDQAPREGVASNVAWNAGVAWARTNAAPLAPKAAEPVGCVGCEDKPDSTNSPCGVCGKAAEPAASPDVATLSEAEAFSRWARCNGCSTEENMQYVWAKSEDRAEWLAAATQAKAAAPEQGKGVQVAEGERRE